MQNKIQNPYLQPEECEDKIQQQQQQQQQQKQQTNKQIN